MYFFRIIQKDLLSLRWVPLVPHPHGDREGEGKLSARFQVGRTDEEATVVGVQLPVIEGDARLEASDLLGRTEAEGEGEGGLECEGEGGQALEFYH